MSVLKGSRGAGLIGGRKQYTLEITTQPLVMASEIAGLEPLHGYIKQEVRCSRALSVCRSDREAAAIHRTSRIGIAAFCGVQKAAANARKASTVPDQPPKKPVQKQSVFPGAARQQAANEKPPDWDESEWID